MGHLSLRSVGSLREQLRVRGRSCSGVPGPSVTAARPRAASARPASSAISDATAAQGATAPPRRATHQRTTDAGTSGGRRVVLKPVTQLFTRTTAVLNLLVWLAALIGTVVGLSGSPSQDRLACCP